MKRVFASAVIFYLTITYHAMIHTTYAQQNSTLTKTDWRVVIDDPSNFKFDRLSIQILFRHETEDKWVSSGFITPSESGKFSLNIPAGSHVVVTVATSDPTIQRQKIAPLGPSFYSWVEDKWIDIAWLEFEIGDNSPTNVERKIELKRGAAISLCVPPDLLKGSILIKPESMPETNYVDTYIFNEVDPSHQIIIGGLKPEQWEISYLDDKDSKQMSKIFNLNSGQLLREACNPPSSAK